MPLRFLMPLMSISRSGADSRILSVAIRLCPPASSRASSLCLARRVTASLSVFALVYANGGGFTCSPRCFLFAPVTRAGQCGLIRLGNGLHDIDRAAQQCFGRLRRAECRMRGQRHVLELCERVVRRQRLIVEDVEPCMADVPAL